MTSRRFLVFAFTGALLALSGTGAQADRITAYTALEEDEIVAYLAIAREEMPELEVDVLRLSTGDLGARILAEAGNPQHDVIWGWAVTNMMHPRILEMIEPYEPDGIERLPEAFRDPEGRWFAPQGYMAAFCVNERRLQQIGAPMPTSWADLLHPALQGEVVMPNPVSSGTGYLQIVSLLQGMGEERGWQFLKDLDANIGQYIRSGSRPCRVAAAGEFAVGASFEFVALKAIEDGFPIKMVIPAEGAGYELEANALMAASQNKEAAKRFLDWTLADRAVEAYTQYKGIVPVRGAPRSAAAEAAGLPEDIETVLFEVDFARSAQEREAILDRWRREIER